MGSVNDYVGEDGLLYCGLCHTARQCRMTFLGKSVVCQCLCTCRQNEQEARRRRLQEQEWYDRICRLKANGIQDKHMLGWRFEAAQDTPTIRLAKRYAEKWEEARAKHLGLLFWGDVGTGKSFAAACIANAVLDRGTPVLVTNFWKMLNQLGGMYREERCQYIDDLSEYALLVIDDLGIERSTEFTLEQIYAVIDERYQSGLPIIITTNHTTDALRNPPDIAHGRIYSRILEMCTPVHVGGDNRRGMLSQSKQDNLREVLGI